MHTNVGAYSVIVPVTARLFHFEEEPEPLALEPMDMLIFRASKCHYGGMVAKDGHATSSIILHMYMGAGAPFIVRTHAHDCMRKCRHHRQGHRVHVCM
jgi:hypothetical protein